MNLVKWFRKNNRKVMAVVVIVIMVGFVGGSALERLLSDRRGDLYEVVAYWEGDKKITGYDVRLAQQELEVLKMLGADELLRRIRENTLGTLDLRALLLGELLFSDRSISPDLLRYVRQMIGTGKYQISNKQLNDIYERPMPGYIYWLLLKKEAELAGITISNEASGRQLAGAIRDLKLGFTYSQVVDSIVSRQGIPENKILKTFGELMSVLRYARIVCSNEDVTVGQIMHNISWQGETIDVELVRFDSSTFAEDQDAPSQQEISDHFSAYKQFLPGDISRENPYGFGYRLADRVKLEYVVVKLDDLTAIVAKPTEEEVEEYYTRNRARFAESVLSDPNDPNSQPTERIRSYAEVAEIISDLMWRDRKNAKAVQILQEARTLTEVGFQQTDKEPASLSAEEFRQAAGDYEDAAEKLANKYMINVYTGQTGLLDAGDILKDEYLGRLYVRGHSETFLPLPQIVFAVDQLKASVLGPFDAAVPRMYENIGPVRDRMGQVMAIVRVIAAQKAAEPESLDLIFSKSTLDLEQSKEQTSQDDPNDSANLFSVREKVVEDLKKLKAMNTAKEKADEFVKQVADTPWNKTIEEFNILYGGADANENDTNAAAEPNATDPIQEPFKLMNLPNLQRVSKTTLMTMAAQSAGNPAGHLSMDIVRKEAQFRDLLYSLVPPDSNSVDKLPVVLEFKPDMSYYILKNISIRRVYRNDYEQSKAVRAFETDAIKAQSLAAVHFNPENITKRMKFKSVQESRQTPQTNVERESEETS
ncbi:MAG: hypothetical protein ACYTBJ_09370 [Planctomycetota bacterium]|jgi:hypothetical protein